MKDVMRGRLEKFFDAWFDHERRSERKSRGFMECRNTSDNRTQKSACPESSSS
jgi:hypothetical protein